MTLAAAKENLRAPMRDRQGLSRSVGARRRPLEESPSPSRKVRAGTATAARRAVKQSDPAVIGRGQGSNSSSAPLAQPRSSAGHLRGRENVHKSCSIRPLLISAPAPRGRPWRADMAIFVLIASWSRSGRSDGPHREDGETAFARYVSPSSRSIAPFSTVTIFCSAFGLPSSATVAPIFTDHRRRSNFCA